MADNRTAARVRQEMERFLRFHDGVQACLTSAFIVGECLFLTNRLPTFMINNPIVLRGALISIKLAVAFGARFAVQNVRPISMMNLLPGGPLLGASVLIRGMCTPYFLIDVMSAFKKSIDSTQNSFLSFIDQQLIRIGKVVDFFNLTHQIFEPHRTRCVADVNWTTDIVFRYPNRELAVFDITNFNPKVVGARNEANEIQTQLKQNIQDWFTFPYPTHGKTPLGRIAVFLPVALILFDAAVSFYLKQLAMRSVAEGSIDVSAEGSIESTASDQVDGATRSNNQTNIRLL